MKRWSPSEAAGVNEFLSTPVGIRWLQEIYSRKPEIDYESGMEKAALSGAYAAGYEKAWKEISNTRIALRESDASVRSIDPTKD